MGLPVVHFEVIGKDAQKLQGYYADLFGWEIDSHNPMNYGIAQREVNADGIGIAGGIGAGPEGTPATSPSTWRFPTWRQRSRRRNGSAASAPWGPEQVMEGVEIGLFTDIGGNTVGVVKSES